MQFVALLATSTLFGGMVLYSFGFAPLVFNTLTPEDAGRLIRRAFSWYYLFVFGVAAGGALLMVSLDHVAATIMAVVAGVAIYERQILMRQINFARDAIAAGREPSKARFNLLHGAAVVLNLIQLCCVGYILFRFLPMV